MLDQIKQNHQIYVIAPLVEESEKIDMENVYELEEKMNKAFGKICKIGVLHGKMKSDEKDEVMKQFKNNEIQILISTTVIEVGVDVPNATMMVIFDSFRFGLSALHQLRGRVGRSSLQSHCFLIYGNRLTEIGKERLKAMYETTDGFKIAELDLKLRGPGEVSGIQQSGFLSLGLSDPIEDKELLESAKIEVEKELSKSIEVQ